MIKNGKYFVAAQRTDENIKTLLARLAAQGAGRPVDSEGYPDGTWTPETLANAISAIEGNPKGIDIRAVQIWFQKNERGINNDNIRWLARIFGCDDVNETSKWQKELIASRDRLTHERFTKRKAEKGSQLEPQPEIETPPLPSKIDQVPTEHCVSKFALGINRLITSSGNIYLLVLVWGAWSILAVLATNLGLASITYDAGGTHPKEVGFYRTPAWTIEKTMLIPVYLLTTSRAVMAWRTYRRTIGSDYVTETWEERISSYRMAFIFITLICIIVVFGLQWYGSYLKPLLDGSEANVMPNWIRVTVNPERIVSLRLMIAVSLFSGVYIAAVYWLCFSTLLLLYIAAQDFAEIKHGDSEDRLCRNKFRKTSIGKTLIVALYRSIICGILMSMLIKVSIVYLDVDAPSITSWLVQDFRASTGFKQEPWRFLGETQLSKQTSLMFLFIITSVAYLAIYRVKSSIDENETARLVSAFRLWIAPVFMVLSFSMIGAFVGFSAFFCLGVLIGIWQLVSPSLAFNTYPFDDLHTVEPEIQ